MLFAVIACLMFLGLYCIGLAVRRLYQLEWAASQAQFIPDEENDSEESGPQLTKLGRPIVEIKLSA